MTSTRTNQPVPTAASETALPRRKTVSIIANPKGGVGKTVLAVLLAETMRERGIDPELIGVDSQNRLSAFYKEKVSMVTPESTESLMASPARAYRVYDPIARRAVVGNALIDVGANEDKGFMEWADVTGFAEEILDKGLRLQLITVTTCDEASVEGAINVLNAGRRALPGAERYLVLNEHKQDDGNTSWGKLKELEKKNVRTLRLPNCVSEVWPLIDRVKQVPYGAVLDMKPEGLMETYGLDRQVAVRGYRMFANWFAAASEVISATLIDEPTAVGK